MYLLCFDILSSIPALNWKTNREDGFLLKPFRNWKRLSAGTYTQPYPTHPNPINSSQPAKESLTTLHLWVLALQALALAALAFLGDGDRSAFAILLCSNPEMNQRPGSD